MHEFFLHRFIPITLTGKLGSIENRIGEVWIILIIKDLRDWSLIKGRGGLQNGRGEGACEVLPLRRGGGGGKSFSHAEGRAQKVLG